MVYLDKSKKGAKKSLRIPFITKKKPKEVEEHRHYWLLEEPNGPSAKGICISNIKHEITGCGAVGDFPNSKEASNWRTSSQMKAASRRGASKGGKAARSKRKARKEEKGEGKR